jgi:transposase
MDPHLRGAGVPDLLRGAPDDGPRAAQAGTTHVVMEASGVYTEPVYYALTAQDFEQVAVINRRMPRR